MSGAKLGECSAPPGRTANHTAEVAPRETGVLIRENIRLHIAEGGVRLVLDTIIEGLDDFLLELRLARMGMHHRLTFFRPVFGISQPKHIHFDAGGDQRNNWMHMLRNAGRGVQGNRRPNRVEILLRDTMPAQEIPRSIGTVDLETLMR